MSTAGSISIKIAGSETLTKDYANAQWAGAIEHVLNFSNGTGANQFDLVFFDERSVNASSNDDIDLAGALSSPLGTSIASAEIVMIAIINKPRSGAANVSNLTIGNGSDPFVGFLGGTTPTVGPIRPGGFMLVGSPDAAGIGSVSGGSSDILRVANGSGGTAVYQIAVFARSA